MDSASVVSLMRCWVGLLALVCVTTVVSGQTFTGDLLNNDGYRLRWGPGVPTMWPMRLRAQGQPLITVPEPVIVENGPAENAAPRETIPTELAESVVADTVPDSAPAVDANLMQTMGRKRSAAVMCYINPISCFGRYPMRRNFAY
ncbi:uncharacterized protein LOC129596845 [Paramacrobiotus metropolitanus]|uniref:uncharacterized protein LOC129596845 n=1 Tax=Paramacrobiotus metropolitanus TaxID=2943436 RepID=UPI002445ADEC|nr:uncharacterized protein LOC129596845 [Paramacrobiotus metropolitanus]